MAITAPTRKYSKKLLMNFLVVVVLGWLILFAWAMSLWGLSDFDIAWNRIYQLSNDQMTSISEFNDASVAEYLKATIQLAPTESLSNKAASVGNSIHEELNTVLPTNELFNNQEFWNVVQLTKQICLLMGLITHVMLIKLTILLAALPLFALTMTAGLVDGLNQRFIRTASLGRESSYVFHRLNHFFKRGLIVLLAVWLAIPMSITPALMFVPVSILLSVMVSFTASRFKKYL